MPVGDADPGRGHGKRLPWVFVVLILAVVTSSSLSVLSLYHVLALQAEVEGLRAEVVRKREEQSGKLEDPVEEPDKQAQQQKQQEGKDKIEVRRTIPGIFCIKFLLVYLTYLWSESSPFK